MEKPKILIVDDKEANIYALLDVMEDIDAHFVTATSGNDAVALTMQHEFALILLDVQMPGMDGFETLEFIRKEDKNKLTPVIFLSAVLTSLDFRIKGITTGAIDFIIKPVEPIILIGKVKHFLELHEYSENLINANSIINATLDATAEGILVLDTNRKVVKINNQFYKMWNYPENFEFYGDDNFVIEHLLNQVKDPEDFREKFERGSYQKCEINRENLLLKNGSIFELNIRPKFIEGAISGYVYNFRDVTDQKKLEEKNIQFIEELSIQNSKLEEKTIQANKLNESLSASHKELIELNANKDKFFAIISHDLRNPLSTLLGYSDLLIEDFKEMTDNEKIDSIIAISDISNNLFELLEGILQWARMQRGQIDFHKEKFILREEGEKIISLLSETARKKEISIINNIKTDIVVNTDKNVVNTILRNLVSNAIKFTNSGGEIKIDCTTSEYEIKITVTDNGIGISADTLKRLFKIEEHITTTGTNKESGAGVGLILCSELIKETDGKIWVESELGIGSKFHFTIPINASKYPENNS